MSTFKELIAEACADEGITYEEFSLGYVLRMSKGGITRHAFGQKMDINPAGADLIAGDKVACYSIMKECGVPAIEHKLFFNSRIRASWLDESGSWQPILDYFEANNRQVVVKLNQGSQGRSVFLCRSLVELEKAVQSIFVSVPDVALCPFYEFDAEYRVFCVKGKAMFAYAKVAPGLGSGLGTKPENTATEGWKHNLSQGAFAMEITDAGLYGDLCDLAERAARCIGINFCTVDIAPINMEFKPHLAVMEINSGVSSQKLLEQMPYRRGFVKGIYAAALREMFASPEPHLA